MKTPSAPLRLSISGFLITLLVSYPTILQAGEIQNSMPLTEEEKIGHVLNRLGYGPSATDLKRIQTEGLESFLSKQFTPERLSDSNEKALQEKFEDLFLDVVPGSGKFLVRKGEMWRYFKGKSEPPKTWNQPGFDDAKWLVGKSGFGYGDDDDETVLEDMQGGEESDNKGYLSLYVRREFDCPDPRTLGDLYLRMRYDDGFVAYLNGKEFARSNVRGYPPRYNQTSIVSGGNEKGATDMFPLKRVIPLLKKGKNTIAVQVHNQRIGSSDLTLIPELAHTRKSPSKSIKGVKELQALMHLRGIYSRKQLQSVLGEFWENHFCTDYDKLEDFIDDLPNYRQLRTENGRRAVQNQVKVEAATTEWREYEFFYNNSLGYFGDLLLYSATSPAMLVYLDSVLNVKREPNENYAREILELYTFGVDNRYTQKDIEELARCFTGWTIRKIDPASLAPFPKSSRTPPIEPSLSIASEKILMDIGTPWKYFKGYREPTPDAEKEPTTKWAAPAFNDRKWLAGKTGFGYGDDDDTTVLKDMAGNYASIYMRKSLEIEIPKGYDDVVLEIAYDDGYVAYMNGVEIGRSANVAEAGDPPAFDYVVPNNHEVDQSVDTIDLERHRSLIKPPPAINTIALQVHNGSLNSSDFSILPRIVARKYRPGSIQVTDPLGVWTFRFKPEEHDTKEKVLFKGTEHELTVPAGRTGRSGVKDAIEVIDALVKHPSTSEFIVMKLINKFVSDEISLESYHKRTASKPLLSLMDDGIAAWNSTKRPGHIRTVMERLLDPKKQSNPFWTQLAYKAKVKTPIEFINSSYRALGASMEDVDLAERTEEMGMTLFRRDDPDGYPEVGFKWMDTNNLLQRLRFCQDLAINGDYAQGNWSIQKLMREEKLQSAEDIVDYFNKTLFQGKLSDRRKAVFLNFANTDDAGFKDPISKLTGNKRLKRLQQVVGLILSAKEFQFQ